MNSRAASPKRRPAARVQQHGGTELHAPEVAAITEEQRLDALRKAIAAGTYRISSEDLAERLIESMRVR